MLVHRLPAPRLAFSLQNPVEDANRPEIQPQTGQKQVGVRPGVKKGHYVRFAQHYQSRKHGLKPQAARQLAAERPLPAQTKDGYHRRRCSVPGCGSITARIVDHIR